MARLVSDRAERTDSVVLLPSSLEDSQKAPPGTYRIILLSACGSIFAFFATLVIAYYWRSKTPPYWDPIPLPPALIVSTFLILLSSVTFEIARRVFRRGEYRLAGRFFLVTGCLG